MSSFSYGIFLWTATVYTVNYQSLESECVVCVCVCEREREKERERVWGE